jgi:hypothetical protein
VVLPAGEVQPENVLHLAADDLLVGEPGELARAAAAADHAALLIADEERGVRGGVIVVQELEEEAEAALGAALRLVAEPRGAVGLGGALTAVGADEEMGHANA